jgi:hypothetical protein
MNPAPPLQRFHDLGDLSDAGYDATIAASTQELARLAEWEAVEAVTRFEGRVTLRRLSRTRFVYKAALTAEIVQNCVVTLEPLHTTISREFSRALHYIPSHDEQKGGEVSLSVADEDEPEVIDSLKFDLAGPLLEEFSLAIDPYPRAPGVEFEAPAAPPGTECGPFAALKALKQG